MRHTVVTRFFNSGKVTVSVRPSTEGEVESFKDHPRYDEYIDVFPTKEEAEAFSRQEA